MRDLDVGPGALVVLHGHGDDPASAREWGRRVAPGGWEVVAPGAPRDVDGVRSWFSSGSRGVDRGTLERSAERVADVVSKLRVGRTVAVVGFSQGGALALSLGLAGCRPDAVVAICGYLPELDDDGFLDALGTAAADPPTLLIAGADDDVVPAFLSTDAATALSAGGRPVTAEVLDGAHEVGVAATTLAREWIRDTTSRRVRISIAMPVDRVGSGADLLSGEAITELATAYERLGYGATYVTDHPAPDDRWLAGGGHQAMEPTVALSVAAAATRHLRLHTNVYVLPYRNPFLAAKALASLDVVSGGRLILGVAAGYLRPEFDALGVGFEDRTARLEDALALLPRIWGETSIAAVGPGYAARAVSAEPRPLQCPHPPIWVGGNSRAALRRAVTLAQGWSPFPTPAGMEHAVRTSAIADVADLRAALDRARAMCEAVGRIEPLTICFVPFAAGDYLTAPDSTLQRLVDEVHELESLGVDWVPLSVPGATRVEVIDRAAQLSEALGLA